MTDVHELNVNLDAALVEGLRSARSQTAAPKPAAAPAGGMKCPSCGAEGVSGKFCTTCGKPLAAAGPKFCTGCGQKVNPGSKFCTGCGAPA